MNRLTLENVVIKYGDITVINDVSLRVDSGEMIFITGANGSGKSTLTKTIAGLLPISSGKITRAEKISYVPQIEEADRNFPAKVREIVLTGTQRKGKLFYSKHDKELAKRFTNALGIDGLVDSEIKTLSGGQLRRVYLARALCGEPELLLLDEPCAGLDIKSHRDFYDILAKINSDGTAIMIVTHDKGDFNEINYNRIIEISDGRILN